MSTKLVIIALLSGLYCTAIPSVAENGGLSDREMVISVWSGNRTVAREDYEREVLKAVLDATKKTHNAWRLEEELSDYEAESEVFKSKGHDIFVTVGGNQKFGPQDRIVVPVPLVKGLLGYRVPIIRAKDSEQFAKIKSAEQLKQLRVGIPATWSDADVYRHNGYNVVERGHFDELFQRLSDDEIDYVAFGANEVEKVFENRAKVQGDLMVAPSFLVYYPFPLVFYVSPERPELAKRVHEGLQTIQKNGELDAIFNRYYGDIVERLNLRERQLFSLENPLLPAYLQNMKPLSLDND